MTTTEAAIIGAGPAGLAAALALARSGVHAALVAPPYEPRAAAADRRTTALIGPSVELLENLGVWSLCARDAERLAAVRIADDREGLFRAPELMFSASELGLESFGANIANPVLVAALNAACDGAPRITRIATAGVRRILPEPARVRLALAEGGEVCAALAVAADGRNSIAPAAAGIAVRAWDYPQAAIVTSFAHTRPHAATVNELHRRSGPLTTVPLPGRRSSLVWAEEPGEAARLAGLDDRAFAGVLEERLQGVLGSVEALEPRALHPLSGLGAARMGAARIALVGEAAHVVPPIGAQGLNLGLRDAATLADCAADAKAGGEDIGGPLVLAAYDRARSADVLARSLSIDLLNRSLLADFLPVDVLRGLAAQLVASFGPLRRLLMQTGMGLAGPLPRLMRPDSPAPGP
jgi:2-octaprenyl-6-methoxyphenol hydroxylase